MTVLLYCSIGAHTKCSTRGCSCDCHDARQTPPLSVRDVRIRTWHCRAGQHDACPANPPSLCTCTCHDDELEPELAITQPRRQLTVTEVLDNAARVIQDRLDQINDELGRYDELRNERKELESALRKLRGTPKKRRIIGSARTDDGPTLGQRVLDVVATDKKADWTITDLIAQLELKGWTPGNSPAQQVSMTCTRLVEGGSLTRVDKGIYKAA